jgi:hypothetical protein
MQTILRDRAEERSSAAATNTGTARRGTAKPTADAILSNVEKGKLPDNPDDWAEARMAVKKNK